MGSKEQTKRKTKLLHEFQAECFRGALTLLNSLLKKREELSDFQKDNLLTMAYICLRSVIITQFGSDDTLHLDQMVNNFLTDFHKGLESNKSFEERW